MGRPRNPDSFSNIISASVPPDTRKEILALVVTQKTTISAIVNTALSMYLKSLSED
jgi:hypothetical protein